MSSAPTLQRYLAAQHVRFDVIPHEPTASSTRTAEACRVSGDCVAKGIVLRRDGGYLLAVLPTSHHVRLADLKKWLGADVEMASESEIDRLLPDCRQGAIPRVGQWPGRGRQHRTPAGRLFRSRRSPDAAHVDHAQFAHPTADARHVHFSDKQVRSERG
jgi:Ala-tRNA(Pro) deacylase